MDWLRYVAGYGDLIAAIGTDEAAAERHYRLYGQREGRSLTAFDALEYGASNADLAYAFGADTHALAAHYIRFGFGEHRVLNSFDALEYGASNLDLAISFGNDPQALLRHYLTYGFNESRALTSFHPLEYAALNGDLASAFGTDQRALIAHYLNYGVDEGRRISGFDAVGYLLSYGDLMDAGLGEQGALRHWINYGRLEGRSATLFGGDQTQHDVGVGRTLGSAFESGADKDWFKVDLVAGQTVKVSLLAAGGVGQGLAGGHISAFDASGHFLAQKSTEGFGFATWLEVTAQTAAPVYLEATTVGGAAAYDVAVAQVAGVGGADFMGDAARNVFVGGTGFHTISGGAGDDLLRGGPNQTLFRGDAGADFIDGSVGTADALSYEFAPTAVEVHLDGTPGVGGFAQGDRLLQIEQVYGSAFGDTLFGSPGADTMDGGAGDDRIYGGDGDDFLIGGAGNDELHGGAGADRLLPDGFGETNLGHDLLDGGEGAGDVADFQSSPTGVRVDLRSGYVAGGASGDTLVSIDTLSGSYYDDVLATSGTSFGSAHGGGGNDIVIARAAGEFASGDNGNDLVVSAYADGGAGDDILVGLFEHVLNYASGGSGSDTFIVDTIGHATQSVFDFALRASAFDASDKIDLSDLRDEQGATLDFADVQRHAHDNVVDLSGFLTSGGASVAGAIELYQQETPSSAYLPYDTADLSAANFVFSGGVNWLATIPANVPLY